MGARPPRPASADIAALVSHELSTPLATALLYIGIAECHCTSDASNAFMRSALSVARGEVQRLKRLVDRVTELERWGRPVIRPRMVDLVALVRTTVRRALVAEARKPSDVSVEARGTLVGWWDDAAVEQIVRNLLSNALKFGQNRAVRITIEPAEHGARVLVRDNGVGLRPADRDRIFERRVHAPAARGGGLGLGLWLVSELVAAHGGQVEVRSRLGHGSTFSVSLPERPPNLAARAATPTVAAPIYLHRTSQPRVAHEEGRIARVAPGLTRGRAKRAPRAPRARASLVAALRQQRVDRQTASRG